jgi:hypothetical protein
MKKANDGSILILKLAIFFKSKTGLINLPGSENISITLNPRLTTMLILTLFKKLILCMVSACPISYGAPLTKMGKQLSLFLTKH